MFSEREKQIIKIIGRRKVTIAQITSELFKGNKILNGEQSVAYSVSRIIKKCGYYKTPWTLNKSRSNKKLYIKRVKV